VINLVQLQCQIVTIIITGTGTYLLDRSKHIIHKQKSSVHVLTKSQLQGKQSIIVHSINTNWNK